MEVIIFNLIQQQRELELDLPIRLQLFNGEICKKKKNS